MTESSPPIKGLLWVIWLAFVGAVMSTGKAFPSARVWFAVWCQLLCRWLANGTKLLLLAANLHRAVWLEFFCLVRQATFLQRCTTCDWHHHDAQEYVWSVQVGEGNGFVACVTDARRGGECHARERADTRDYRAVARVFLAHARQSKLLALAEIWFSTLFFLVVKRNLQDRRACL